jgi:hypothetical protein
MRLSNFPEAATWLIANTNAERIRSKLAGAKAQFRVGNLLFHGNLNGDEESG